MAVATDPIILDSTGQAIVSAINGLNGRVSFVFGALPVSGTTGTFYFAPDENDNTIYNGFVWDETGSTFRRISSSITVDATPTSGSNNPVSSGGVYTAIANLQTQITALQS